MGILYVVATPIGNMQDITLRAIEILKNVPLIACEDTRHTGSLLQKLNISNRPKLISLFEENEKARIPEILKIFQEGLDVALVTNAGTPAISDPGFRLIRECVNNEIKVVPLPGPNSVITSLSASGLPTDKFTFIGFLPNKSSQRIKLLNSVNESLKDLSSTIIFFESPYRLLCSLHDLTSVFGDIKIVIARELTKVYEEISKDNISNFILKYKNPKGEFVILFNLKDGQ